MGFKNVQHSYAFNKSAWSDKKDPAALRIMTWNVQGFVNIMPQNFPQAATRIQMLKIIQQVHPDILCFQEYWNVENAKWLISVRHELDSLGYEFHFFSNDSIKMLADRSIQIHGVAIFSFQPFIDSGRINIVNRDESENCIYTDVFFQHKPIRIFTAHLQSFSLYFDTTQESEAGKNLYQITYQRKRVVQHKLREVEQTHEDEIKIIRAQINKSPYPVIYCGDMNAVPCSYNYNKLRDDLQDAFLEKGAGIGATFYKILPTLRIDYCFADKRFKVMQCKVIQQKLSDHYPVITDLTWK